MTTQPGSEPTWYHRTVDAEPAAFAGTPTGPAAGGTRPDRKVKAIAAAFVVVILCAMGVSVAALSGGAPTDDEAAGGTARKIEAQEAEAEEAVALQRDSAAEPTADDEATSDRDSAGGVEQSEKKPGTGSTGTGSKPPTTKPPTTKPPTTTPPVTKAPTTTAPSTTSTTAPAPKPEVLTVSAPSSYACSEAPEFQSPNTVTVSWTTKNATSVSIAIDNPTGIYQSGLPANGSMELPAPCHGDTQTYYVIANGTGGATATKSATTNGI